MYKRLFMSILALSLVFTTACSKGKSNSGLFFLLMGSMPPGVASVTPAANATGIAVTATVRVTFTKNMDPGTITNTTFTLTDGEGGPVTGTVTCDGRTATFSPASPLAYLATYTATLTTAIMDPGGKPLEAAYSWSFTTASAGQVPAPEFSVDPGTYDSTQNVALSCDDLSADIYYTTNGDDPNEDGTHYSGETITVDRNMTVRAIAIRADYDDSEEASGTYLIRAPKPSFTPEAGEHNNDIDATLSVTGDATIYYTTGTGDPDTLYTEGDIIKVHGDGESVTVRAWAVKDGLETSDIVEAAYSVNYSTAAAPTFDPEGATFDGTQTVTLETTTDGATIRYTMDGSDPGDAENANAHNVASGGTVEIAENTTLKAYAFKDWMKDSGTTSQDYFIHVAAPTANEEQGTHDHDLEIHLSVVEGATIYYTLGTGDPDIEYSDTSPILIEGDNATATIRAKAVKTNMTDSGAVSFSYAVEWDTVETPVFDPTGASFTTTQDVTITSTDGSTIRYTTDGNDPSDEACTTYIDAPSPATVTVDDTKTIRAFAFKGQMLDSEEAQEDYILAPTLATISPAEGIGTGTVSVTLTGTNFKYGADVRIGMTGQSDIVATNVVVTGPTKITADLDIDGAARGYWDVVVTNSDTGSATLSGGLHVTANTDASLSGLELSAGTLDPTFDGNTILYYVRVTDGSTSMTVTPTVADENATVTVNGAAAVSGSPSTVTFSGNTRIAVTVTAEDAVTQKTYVVSVMTCPRFAYVTNRGDNTVSIYTVNAATGQLRHNGYYNHGSLPVQEFSTITVDPTGRFAYANIPASFPIIPFTINQRTGALTAGTAVGNGTTPIAVKADPTGRFLYTANSDNTVSVYAIDQTTGALTARTAAAITPPYAIKDITIDPSGRFVYVAHSGAISVFAIDQATGELSAGADVALLGAGPNSIAVDPSGRHVYLVNSGVSDAGADVACYTIHPSTGALTGGTTYTTGSYPLTIAIDPSGRFAYVAHNAGTIMVYTIDRDTGALTSKTTVSTDLYPTSIWADPSGMFVYVAHSANNRLTAYSIDQSSGILTEASKVSGRSGPYCMAMTSRTSPVTYVPKFAYVANWNTKSVSMFSINSSNGALTYISLISSFGDNPVSVTTNPAGTIAYVANASGNNIAIYTINQSTGVLVLYTTISAGGTGPWSISIDPSGKFAYCALMNSNIFSEYTVTQSTGYLTSVGSMSSNGSNPWSGTVDPSGRFAFISNNSGSVVNYMINQNNNGMLSTGAIVTGVPNPLFMTADPSGRFVYTANGATTATISVFTINKSSGELTAAGTVATGGYSYGMAVDPMGRFAFVVNSNLNTLSAFTIDQASGALSGETTISAGATPYAVTVDPSGRYVYVANFGGTDLYVYRIDQTSGALTYQSTASNNGQGGPASIAIVGVIQ